MMLYVACLIVCSFCSNHAVDEQDSPKVGARYLRPILYLSDDGSVRSAYQPIGVVDTTWQLRLLKSEEVVLNLEMSKSQRKLLDDLLVEEREFQKDLAVGFGYGNHDIHDAVLQNRDQYASRIKEILNSRQLEQLERIRNFINFRRMGPALFVNVHSGVDITSSPAFSEACKNLEKGSFMLVEKYWGIISSELRLESNECVSRRGFRAPSSIDLLYSEVACVIIKGTGKEQKGFGKRVTPFDVCFGTPSKLRIDAGGNLKLEGAKFEPRGSNATDVIESILRNSEEFDDRLVEELRTLQGQYKDQVSRARTKQLELAEQSGVAAGRSYFNFAMEGIRDELLADVKKALRHPEGEAIVNKIIARRLEGFGSFDVMFNSSLFDRCFEDPAEVRRRLFKICERIEPQLQSDIKELEKNFIRDLKIDNTIFSEFEDVVDYPGIPSIVVLLNSDMQALDLANIEKY